MSSRSDSFIARAICKRVDAKTWMRSVREFTPLLAFRHHNTPRPFSFPLLVLSYASIYPCTYFPPLPLPLPFCFLPEHAGSMQAACRQEPTTIPSRTSYHHVGQYTDSTCCRSVKPTAGAPRVPRIDGRGEIDRVRRLPLPNAHRARTDGRRSKRAAIAHEGRRCVHPFTG